MAVYMIKGNGMCRIVIVGKDEVECSNHGELTDALGGMPVYRNVDDQERDDCLCDLDSEKTAAAFGYEVADNDGMFVVFAALATGQSGIKST